MKLIDPNSLPQDHPALVPDLWVRAMLAHPLVTAQNRQHVLSIAGLWENEDAGGYSFVTQNHEAVLVSSLAETLARRSFGAEAGQLMDPHRGSVLTYILLAAKNLEDLLALLARYLPISRVNSTCKVEKTAGGVSVYVANNSPIIHRNAQYTEFAMSTVIRLLAAASGRQIVAQKMSFLHEDADPKSELNGVFQCPLEFGARRNEIVFSSDILDYEIASFDNRLLGYLSSYANILLQSRHPGESTLRDKIEEIVLQRLSFGVPSLPEVAEAMGVSTRTLSRRLAEQDATFRQIVDHLRHDLAVHYLADANLTLADITYLLGYSDQSSFGAAFRRMSGKTPNQFRIAL